VDTTKESFQITMGSIAESAATLELLAGGLKLEYRHNGAGHAPYVYAIAADGSTDDAATRDVKEFLPEFTYKFTRRESMAALEATARALRAAAMLQRNRARFALEAKKRARGEI
jgi:hypothetical protein